jgi:hypothetical protein
MLNISDISKSSTPVWKASKVSALMWATVLAAWCASTSSSYTPPVRHAPVALVYPSTTIVAPRWPDLTDAISALKDLPTLVSKVHTHNWPLKDPICTYTYTNKAKVLSLCLPKQPQQISNTYKKLVPWESVYKPATSEYVPGYDNKYMAPERKYGYNPKTGKHEYFMTPGWYQLVPKWYVQKPGRWEQLPSKNVSCYMAQNFSQKDGAPTGKSEICTN